MSQQIRLAAWLDAALPPLLPDFLPRQRWFGGKARPIASVAVEDTVWLDAVRPCAIAVIVVRYGDGGRQRNAVLLAFDTGEARLPVVGGVAGPAPAVVEAGTDADAVLALLRGFAPAGVRELPMQRGGKLHYRDVDEVATGVLGAGGDRPIVRPFGVEQSNTSLRLDQTLVFKLFRTLEAGENPELEMGRFLATRTSFRAMPRVRGSLTYVSAAGEPATLGVLQDWVDNHGDGWSHVVRTLKEAPDEASRSSLRDDLFSLGATTAKFHAALASDTALPAFAPEPATSADVRIWHASLHERLSRTFRLVERSMHAWPESTRALGAALMRLRDSPDTAAAMVDERAAPPRFRKIRVHGDYHLGQTLKTDDGFVLIDFEGEPARPLAERCRKECALRDVAGMLRSCDYAVETAHADDGADAAAVARQGQRLRGSFLAGYLLAAAERDRGVLPRDRVVLNAWIDFFEVEKALYEVEYEINNRPTWVHIPLGGIVRILERHV